MKIGFALITEDPFFGELIRRENALGEAAGFLDKLGPIHRLPHTTLFQGMMREDIPFESIAMELAENYLYFCPDRRVTFGDIVYVPEGWYFLEAEKDDRLQHIHDLLLERLGPYMVLDSRRLDRDTSFMSQAEKAGIEKYDYRYAGEAFYPHITLGRSLDGDPAPTLELVKQAFADLDRSTRFGRVTVYLMGPNGVHQDTLFEAPLTGGPHD